MIAQVLAAAVGTVAFALLFGVPRKYYFYCGLVGGGRVADLRSFDPAAFRHRD